MYAPCDGSACQVIWDALSVRLQALRGKKVCIYGDFNAVRCRKERKSVMDYVGVADCAPFNHFIEENVFLDLALCGRKFT